MGRGAGAAAGGSAGVAGASGAAGVGVSGAVVGEVCATPALVATNNEAINAAARTMLGLEVFLMIRTRFPPVQALQGTT